jgi:SSS family solute:Na+ symporter
LGLQPIHHPARAGAKSIREAQKGIVLAAFLKLLMPVLVVVPGIAAVAFWRPTCRAPDEAYPHLMTLLPPGLLGWCSRR